MSQIPRETLLAAADLIAALAKNADREVWERLSVDLAVKHDPLHVIEALASLASGLARGYGERRDWALQVVIDTAVFGGGSDAER